MYGFVRLFFGVDFFDEAYWVGFQWRFALGDRPYLDEHSFHQNFAVFLFPLVVLFRKFSSGSDGIILFTRLFFFSASLFGSFLTYRFFTRRLGSEAGTLFAGLFLLMPISTPNFSYTSLGINGLLLGALCLLEAAETNRKWIAFSAGIFHAIATASDPSQIPTVLILVCVGMAFSKQRSKLALFYFTPLLTIGVAMVALAGVEGMKSIFESSRYLDHASYSIRFFKHAKDLFAVPYRALWLCCWVMVAIFSWKNYRPGLATALVILPIACLFLVMKMGYGSGFYFAYLGLAGFGVFLFVKSASDCRRFFWSLWVPSLLAAIAYTWAGNRGGVARFGTGMILGMFATQYFLLRAMELFLPRARNVPLGVTLLCLLVIGVQSPVFQEVTVVPSGPYRGLRTEKGKVEWIVKIQDEVGKRSQLGRRIVFHPHFPAGYLITAMRPAAGNLWWTYPQHEEAARAFLRDYQRYEKETGLAVVVHQLVYSERETNPADPGPLDKLLPRFKTGFSKTFSSPAFDIYENPLSY